MNDIGIPTHVHKDVLVQVHRRKDIILEVLGDLHPMIELFSDKHKSWLNEALCKLPEEWTEVDILPYLESKLGEIEVKKEQRQKVKGKKYEKMGVDAIHSKAKTMALLLWRSAFDVRHKSDGNDEWSHIIKDTTLSSKWYDSMSCNATFCCEEVGQLEDIQDDNTAWMTESEEEWDR